MLPTRMRCRGVIGSSVSRFAKPAASASPSIQTIAPVAPAAMIESVHTALRLPDQPYSTVGADQYAPLVPDPIVIVESDPMWPGEFERLRTRAADAVGEVAVAIEHVGSTAVPGLAAKPVIDLVVVVEPQDLQTAIERLVAIGYVHQGNLGVEGREAFGVPEEIGRAHV